jgi:hypothetical protein
MTQPPTLKKNIDSSRQAKPPSTGFSPQAAAEKKLTASVTAFRIKSLRVPNQVIHRHIASSTILKLPKRE